MTSPERAPTSHSSKSTRKRKRAGCNAEREQLVTLQWTASSSISPDADPFSSLLVGSDDFDGGFISLEEIDEANYMLPLPKTGECKVDAMSKSKKRKDLGKSGNSAELATTEKLDQEKKKAQEAKKEKSKKKKKRNKNNLNASLKDIEFIVDAAAESDEKDELENDSEVFDKFNAWDDLRLHPLLMKSIVRLGFKEPTPIQKACIPAAAHQGKDVVGAAETGSGKTLAFGLPILQRLLDEREKVVRMLEEKGKETEKNSATGYLRALIITPTRELTLQVTNHLKDISKGINIRVVPLVGGMSTEKQERLLRTKPEIIVGTPGRLWELMSNGVKHLVELHSLSFFVLDEADRMIENGHFHELQSIIDMLPITSGSGEGQTQHTHDCSTISNVSRKKRQTFVFSATIALSADFRKKLKRGFLNAKHSDTGNLNSIEILSERAGMRANVAIFDLTTTSILAHKLEESFIECREEEKDSHLYYILSVHGQGHTIIFCTSIAALRHISAILRILGLNVWTLHSMMEQRARLKALDRFCINDHGILVATDVAARGLDIPGIRTVIHYQLPHSAEVYVHRSGRTARALADGCSIALISPKETAKFVSLCRSFSKESVKRFPLVSSYMPEITKRLSLARQIDKLARKDCKEKANKNWIMRNAESLEIDMGNDESEEEMVKNHKQKKLRSMQLNKLQQDLKKMLSHPLRPKSFSHRYVAGSGISLQLQQQFEDLAKQKLESRCPGADNKRRKLVVIGQDCMEPLQALRSAGSEVMDMKQMAEKRRNMENLRKKRKEEKKRMHEQRRKQKKRSKGGAGVQ